MADKKGDIVEMFTDGACSGNPGPGGWGVLMIWQGREKELFGGERETTNNRMELMAAIKGLGALNKKSRVRLYTDSKYVRDGITDWLPRWKQNGWKTAARKPVKNEDLWRRLEAAAEAHDIDWKWVKGHAGVDGNERADVLANQGMAEVRG